MPSPLHSQKLALITSCQTPLKQCDISFLTQWYYILVHLRGTSYHNMLGINSHVHKKWRNFTILGFGWWCSQKISAVTGLTFTQRKQHKYCVRLNNTYFFKNLKRTIKNLIKVWHMTLQLRLLLEIIWPVPKRKSAKNECLRRSPIHHNIWPPLLPILDLLSTMYISTIKLKISIRLYLRLDFCQKCHIEWFPLRSHGGKWASVERILKTCRTFFAP